MPKLTPLHIASYRLQTQQLLGSEHKSVKDLVSFMGVMQAQDYPMSKWAVGSRLPATDKQVEEAIDKGEIIRTHLLRPTWHLAAAEDVKWMLELSAPQIKTIMRSSNKQLGLTPEVFSKSNKIFEKTLAGGKHFTREELTAKLEAAKIDTKSTRGLHMFLQAEMDGILCSGPMKNKKTTYAFLPDRLPKIKTITRQEALAKLAQRYFKSHGPATLKDFIWWSGLSVADSKQALESVKHELYSERVGEEEFWFSTATKFGKSNRSTFLLPAFDEYLISYKSRAVSILSDHQPRAFTKNGIFKPIIVEDGQVTGTWKRTVKKDQVLVEAEFFEKKKGAHDAIRVAAKEYGKFLGLKAEMHI